MTKSISFCTTCRNRVWQLRETLPKNLESISDAHEIVLVDYGSTDGLSEWIWNDFKVCIENKKLVFFEVKNEVRWNVARAKNLAHRLASGSYLFNLDADNFITPSDIQAIQKAADLGLHCWQFSQGNRDDGSFGRIGIPADLFRQIGGYDETFLPMGCQDIDLLNRLVALKQKRAHLNPPKIQALQNTVEQKVAEIKKTSITYSDPGSVFRIMDQLNVNLTKFKLQTEGPIRSGGWLSYKGVLNGQDVTVDGLDNLSIKKASSELGGDDESHKRKSISFCTTSRNRLWQLKQTLPGNLEVIEDDQEIVLIDFGSKDGLSDWIWSNFKGYIDSNKLIFFEVKNEVRWNVARAKNLAHRLGSGNYLFNLDADNHLTTKDLQFIKEAAQLNLSSLQWSTIWGDGSFGRIGSPREVFHKIGGYDESLLATGGQDLDLINRLSAMQYKLMKLPPPNQVAVQNTKIQKVSEFCSFDIQQEILGEEIYSASNQLSLQLSKFKLETEGPIRLGGGFSYRGRLNSQNVLINGFNEITLCSE